MNEEMQNESLLLLMEELLRDPYFYKSNNLLVYEYPKDNETFDGRKIIAMWNLHKLGGISIYNKGEEHLSGNMYRFEIIVHQPAFDGVFERCVRAVRKMELDEYHKLKDIEVNQPAIKLKLNETIKIYKIKGKERKLLETLSDFELHSIRELHSISDSVSSMRTRLNKKLNTSGFLIKSLSNKGWRRLGDGNYQLDYNKSFSNPPR